MRKPFLYLPVVAMLLVATGSPAQDPAANPAGNPSYTPLGTNLEGLSDWSRALMFSDAMKTARRFGAPDKPWEPTVELDANGWPKADAGCCIITDVPNIGGTYRLSFRGKAEVNPRSEGVRVANLQYAEQTDTSTAEVVVESSATQLWLSWEKTRGGVRNVRLLRPGYRADRAPMFHIAFLKQLPGFQVFRFMDFIGTNNSAAVRWEERSQVDDATYATGKGGPWEYVVEMGNSTGRDVWICVPDQVDDEYVRSLARYLKGALRFEINIYLEYSNEVWNWQFQQAQRNLAAAKADAARAGSRLRVAVSPEDDPNNEGYWAWKRVAQRLMEMSLIFEEVFGKGSLRTRVRPVLASQYANPFTLELQLDFIRKHFGKPSDRLYGVACAPYFYLPDELQKKPDLTKTEVLDALSASVDALNKDASVAWHSVARWNGLPTLAYEGGVDVGQREEGLEAKVAANRDPRMREILERYINGWWRSGGDLFMYFGLTSPYTKWGCWGLNDDVSLTKDPPKMQAARKLTTAPPPGVTGGLPVPGLLTGASPALDRWTKPRAMGEAGSPIGNLTPEDRLTYLVRLPKGARLRVDVRASVAGGALPLVGVDSTPVELRKTAEGWNGATAPLEAGLHAVRLGSTGGTTRYQDVRLSR